MGRDASQTVSTLLGRKNREKSNRFIHKYISKRIYLQFHYYFQSNLFFSFYPSTFLFERSKRKIYNIHKFAAKRNKIFKFSSTPIHRSNSFNKLLTRMQLFENDRCRTHHYRNQTANEIYPRVFVSAFSIVNLCSLLPFSGQRHPSPLPLVFLVIYRHSSFTFHVRVPVGTRRHDAS